jgi:putative lipoprotein
LKADSLKTIAATALLLGAGAAFAQASATPPAEPAATQVASPAATEAAPPPPPPADPSLLPMRNAVEYVCGDGLLVVLERDAAAGLIRGVRAGETFTLFEQVGRTPPRFVNGSDSVDLDGDTAQLRRGKTARQTCQRIPAQPTSGVVWGTLTKLDRMALPAGTRVKVLVVDGARMDAPAVELGSTLITTTGNQVPLHYLVKFDAARTAGPAKPMLQARSENAKGELMYITDMVNALPNETTPASPIELRLVRPGGQ